MMNFSLPIDQGREQQRADLLECAKQEDFFDFFVRMVIKHVPSVYIFINFILIVWIGGTAVKSKNSDVPSSLYLITPMLNAQPFTTLTTTTSECPADTQLLSLKQMPTIHSINFQNRSLYGWDDPSFKFCIGQVQLQRMSVEGNCTEGKQLCSGYCVEFEAQCPITRIKVSRSSKIGDEYAQFYKTQGDSFQFSRVEGRPIIDMLAIYATLCANDEHSTKQYNTEQQYWNDVKDCKGQGRASFFKSIHEMSTNTFMANNKVPITVTDDSISFIQLGYVSEFEMKNSTKCRQVGEKARVIEDGLANGSLESSLYTNSLLIIAFILLLAQAMWIIAYCCVRNRFQTELNILALMLSIIELVVIGFITAQNQILFRVGDLANDLQECLVLPLQAIQSWHFGFDSPRGFYSVLFVNTAFICVFLCSLCCDKCVFSQYQREQVMLPRRHPNLRLF